jgi:radical SAM protein with 4Fe4S-binding SPASM domain
VTTAGWTLNPEVVLRPETRGALAFNPRSAETAYLSKDALVFLRGLVRGKIPISPFPASLFLYFRRTGFIIPAKTPERTSLQDIEQCLEAKVPEVPRSLSAPETLHIALTDACDQVCPGCFYSKTGSKSGSFMSRQLFRKILSLARNVRVFQFAFGGGEPLLHPDVLFFVRETRKVGIVPNVTTNGNFLTEELAAGLKKGGIGQVQISLDGATREENERTRPNYDQAVRALEVCRRIKLRFGVNSLVTRENFRRLPALFRFAEGMGASGINLLRPKPPVLKESRLDEMACGPEQNRELPELLARESRRARLRITLDQSLSFLAYERDPEELYQNGVWGCGAGRRFVSLDPEGRVYPCSHYRKPIGFEGDFMRAWRNSTLLGRFRGLEETLRGRCRSCRFIRVCRGCRAVVTALGQGFLEEDPHCPRLRSQPSYSDKNR